MVCRASDNTIFTLPESPGLAVDQIQVLIMPIRISEKELLLLHRNTIIAFARNEVAFTCRQIKQLLRFISERSPLNLVTACGVRNLGILVLQQ